jgi:hypothetical protein
MFHTHITNIQNAAGIAGQAGKPSFVSLAYLLLEWLKATWQPLLLNSHGSYNEYHRQRLCTRSKMIATCCQKLDLRHALDCGIFAQWLKAFKVTEYPSSFVDESCN